MTNQAMSHLWSPNRCWRVTTYDGMWWQPRWWPKVLKLLLVVAFALACHQYLIYGLQEWYSQHPTIPWALMSSTSNTFLIINQTLCHQAGTLHSAGCCAKKSRNFSEFEPKFFPSTVSVRSLQFAICSNQWENLLQIWNFPSSWSHWSPVNRGIASFL